MHLLHWVKHNFLYLLNLLMGVMSFNNIEHLFYILTAIAHFIVVLLGIWSWFEKRKKRNNYYYNKPYSRYYEND